VDARRRAQRRTRHELPLEEMGAEPPQIRRIGQSRSVEILGALTRLPLVQHRIIKWLKVDDLSVRQIARRLRMTESAVKVAAHRGYATLRRHFGVRPGR
jgi:RNA polymerase sigma-70 factor (ECF subfamily)